VLDLGQQPGGVKRAPAIGALDDAREKRLAVARGTDDCVIGGCIESDQRGHLPIVAIDRTTREGDEVNRTTKRSATVLACLAIGAFAALGAGCGDDDVNDAVDDAQQQAEKAGNKIEKGAKDVKQGLPDDAEKKVNEAGDKIDEAADDAGDAASDAADDVSGDDKGGEAEPGDDKGSKSEPGDDSGGGGGY
jgi:hypothetical protein